MFIGFDPKYFLYLSPAIILMMWAQWRIRSAYARGMQIPAGLSGAAAARHILDEAGLHDVPVEETHGHLSDHYDPRERVVRLSSEVYRSASATAVGIAAHEVGHALQHAQGYLPLVVRNAAAPAAQFGPMAFMILFIIGMLLKSGPLIMLGLAFYAGLVVFQLVNLPVEFDASNRAKKLLVQMRIIDDRSDGSAAVRSVLGAAGWTYVAGTLESIMTLLYYISILTGGRSSNDDRA